MEVGNKILSIAEQKQIKQTIIEFEKSTGAELVVAITGQSDPYPAANWRFAVLAATLICAFAIHYIELDLWLWPMSQAALIIFIAMNCKFKWITRFFASQESKDRECQEKAIEVFQVHAQSLVQHHVSTMIFISLLEHETIILFDEKIKEKISSQELVPIIDKMHTYFKNKNFFLGITHGANELEKLITQYFPNKVEDKPLDELPNEIIWL